MLCKACQSIFTRGESEGVHHKTPGSFEAACAAKCAICGIVQEVLASKGLLAHYTPTEPFSRSRCQPGPPSQSIVIDVQIDETSLKELIKEMSTTFYLVRIDVRLADADYPDMDIRSIKETMLAMADDAFVQHIPSSTGDAKLSRQVKHWLEKCLTTHEKCRRNQQNNWHPRRLIDVSGNLPRLILHDEQPCRPYATLSHCWGSNPTFITLSADNLDSMRSSIPLANLPANFRDAITVTRRLGIHYLWIDSLCILQSGLGSVEDWHDHAVAMRVIYQNSLINISADRAVNAAGGLFTTRDPSLIQPCLIHRARDDNLLHAIVPARFFEMGINETPLARRAWVLQERLLAPRAVHFSSKQLFWECAEAEKVCESYPEGLPHQGWSMTEGAPFAFDVDGSKGENVQGYYEECWRRILTTYTRCELTRPAEDKFVALAGVARRMATLFGDDEYLAGFFRHQLPGCLLWNTAENNASRRPGRSKQYRAPSWSWASMDGALDFSRGAHWRPTSLLKSVRIDLANNLDPFGQVTYAELVSQGPVLDFCWSSSAKGGVTSFVVAVHLSRPGESYLTECSFDEASEMGADQAGCIALSIAGSQCLTLRPVVSSEGVKYARLGMVAVTTREAVKACKSAEWREVVLKGSVKFSVGRCYKNEEGYKFAHKKLKPKNKSAKALELSPRGNSVGYPL